jgi:hypothetical protein
MTYLTNETTPLEKKAHITKHALQLLDKTYERFNGRERYEDILNQYHRKYQESVEFTKINDEFLDIEITEDAVYVYAIVDVIDAFSENYCGAWAYNEETKKVEMGVGKNFALREAYDPYTKMYNLNIPIMLGHNTVHENDDVEMNERYLGKIVELKPYITDKRHHNLNDDRLCDHMKNYNDMYLDPNTKQWFPVTMNYMVAKLKLNPVGVHMAFKYGMTGLSIALTKVTSHAGIDENGVEISRVTEFKLNHLAMLPEGTGANGYGCGILTSGLDADEINELLDWANDKIMADSEKKIMADKVQFISPLGGGVAMALGFTAENPPMLNIG